MKSSNVLQLHLDPDLKHIAESALREGETLPILLEVALRMEIDRRLSRRDFLARGLAAGERARRSGRYIDAKDVLLELEDALKKASTDDHHL
jgi:predicted transcriptional regulator